MRLYFSLILSLITISAFSQPDREQEGQIEKAKQLIGNWNYTAILNSTNDTVKQVADGDIISFASDNTFYYYLQSEHIYATGTYSVSNNAIALHYDALPNGTGIDSSIVDTSIFYYLNGNILRSIAPQTHGYSFFSGSLEEGIIGWQTDSIAQAKLVNLPRNTRTYQINLLSETEFTISENGVRFQFSRPQPFVEAQSGFSFSGILKGIISLFILLLIGYAVSEKRGAINWKLIIKGIALQFVLALLVLKVPFVERGFETLSALFVKVISFAQDGAKFLFSSFVSGEIESSLVNFVVMVLPTIIFFSALTSLLYYWGILQKVVFAFAWVMKRFMKLSGAESLAAAGNIFLGQTESPLLVRPYLDKMTRSEMMCLMAGGMATIAGGVLAAYIGFLGGASVEEQVFFAKHLLTASVMSAPAAVVAAKLIVPETEKFAESFSLAKNKIGSNVLEAIANGTTDGLKLAVNIGAMLLVFIALIALGNFMLSGIIGEYTGLNAWIAANTAYSELSFQFIIGYAFAPLAWMMGVNTADMVLVGQLLGEKTILNEFYAYVTLGDMKSSGQFAHGKSIVIATYILCGFANFASIGIQIGGIGALVPERKGLLSSLGIKALIAGTLACLFTASIVGMFYL